MITKMGVPFNGLAGAGFSGSYKGMRFFMKTYDKENISVFVYPEPYNFENTKDENKEKVSFLILTKAWTSALTGLIRNTLMIKINGMRHLIQE